MPRCTRYLVDVKDNLDISLVITFLLLFTYVGFAVNDGGTSLRRSECGRMHLWESLRVGGFVFV
jgi:hypothetical protein